MSVDGRYYRDVMGHLPTGVVALGSIEPGTGDPVGLVVGTFQSLSLDPPLVSFSVARTSTSWPKMRPRGSFTASVLAAGQDQVCQALSGKQPDKFATVDWTASDNGCPRVTGAVAWVDCEIRDELDGGDHLIVVAVVRGLTAQAGEPLIFHRGRLGAYRQTTH
jgi:3-hydroxy-9,10-secoandrosta-1,3,5(10)-triene-9,17-dione monooxygenase reductase component